ncbi:hypothetical protein PVAP13_1NG136619, partial [Panicum virgatum]
PGLPPPASTPPRRALNPCSPPPPTVARKHQSSFRGPPLRHAATTHLLSMAGRRRFQGVTCPGERSPTRPVDLPRPRAAVAAPRSVRAPPPRRRSERRRRRGLEMGGRSGPRRCRHGRRIRDPSRVEARRLSRARAERKGGSKVGKTATAARAECERRRDLPRTKEAAPAHRHHDHFRQEEGRGSCRSESHSG